MNFKRIKCFLIAVIDFFKYKSFMPQHIFVTEKEEPAIIIATDNSFRVSDNFQHSPEETVYPNATLIHCKCERCGYVTFLWKNNNEHIPVMYDNNRGDSN